MLNFDVYVDSKLDGRYSDLNVNNKNEVKTAVEEVYNVDEYEIEDVDGFVCISVSDGNYMMEE